jgi:hypothetical protein
MISRWRGQFLLLLLLLIPCALPAQVSSNRLIHSSDEPQNWLTYSGSYSSHRYSGLQQIGLANIKDLELKWVFQAQSLQKFESTPLVVDGVMYRRPTMLWRLIPGRVARSGSITTVRLRLSGSAVGK